MVSGVRVALRIDELESCVAIDEPLDEPGAADAVDLHALPSHPGSSGTDGLGRHTPLLSWGWVHELLDRALGRIAAGGVEKVDPLDLLETLCEPARLRGGPGGGVRLPDD